jgi:hypothetical protein
MPEAEPFSATDEEQAAYCLKAGRVPVPPKRISIVEPEDIRGLDAREGDRYIRRL